MDERATWPVPARIEWFEGPDRTVTRAFARLTPAARIDWLEEVAEISWLAKMRRGATA